jgi:hypothetical protein
VFLKLPVGSWATKRLTVIEHETRHQSTERARDWVGTVISARKKSGKLRSFAAVGGSVELFARYNIKSFSASPSPPICCCCQSLLLSLLMLLLQMADFSCRISGKFSAFLSVHFWLIIRLSFVVFCFSIHRMRSSSSLWFYAMLALWLVVLFWHVLISVVFSFLVLPGFLVYELAFSGCFLLLVTSHAVLIAAILCDGCLVLACLVLVIFHFLSDSTSFFGL